MADLQLEIRQQIEARAEMAQLQLRPQVAKNAATTVAAEEARGAIRSHVRDRAKAEELGSESIGCSRRADAGARALIRGNVTARADASSSRLWPKPT